MQDNRSLLCFRNRCFVCNLVSLVEMSRGLSDDPAFEVAHLVKRLSYALW